MIDKTVVIVNGKGGVGKDTLCSYFCRYYGGQITSSINPIKKYAKRLGWKGGKEPEDRLFLAELKRIMDERFNTTKEYLKNVFGDFMRSEKRVLFVMIREPEQIEEFKQFVDKTKARVLTLLIRRDSINIATLGNFADDGVEGYHYDYIFENNSILEEAHRDFVVMIKHMTEEIIR